MAEKDKQDQALMISSTYIRLILLFAAIALLAERVEGQSENGHLREGNEYYSKKKFSEADLAYRKGLEKNPVSFEGSFNLGDVLYQQEKYEDAATRFKMALESAKTEGDKSMAYYNLGNSLLKLDKLDESIDAYKQSLRLYPGDARAQYNLSYALRKKREQQQNQQQNQNQDQSQQQDEQQNKEDQNDGQNQQDQQGQDQQDQNKEGQEKGQNEQGQRKEDQSQSGNQNQSGEPQEGQVQQMPKADALRLLEALEGQEQKVRAKILKKKAKENRKRTEKEW